MGEPLNWQDAWVKKVTPDEPNKLARRLAWEGVSEHAFAHKLGETPALGETGDLSWGEGLEACQAALKSAWDLPLLPIGDGEQLAFVDLWWPIRERAIGRLRDAVVGNEAGIAPSVAAQLADGLIHRLCLIGDQVLMECFRAEVGVETMLMTQLRSGGVLPRERYEAFVRRNRRDGLDAVLREYPVFGRFIGTVYALWVAGSEEMLERLRADRGVLEERFGIPRGATLTEISQGLGDPHRGGRAVAMLRFTSPDGRESVVVYKPKDMRVDAAYQSLLRDLNAASGSEPLRTLGIEVCDGYGYIEFVPHKLSADGAELSRFYWNAGRLSAVLHLLGCTDCHYENLIACGDQLLLIDTETLLDVDLPDHVGAASNQSELSKRTELQERFDTSILRSGLLPQWMFLGDAREPADISALGVTPPEGREEFVSGWLGLNSDGMLPGSVRRATELPTSLPVGIGEVNRFAEHLDAYVEGFRDQCRAVIEARKLLLQPGGALARFAGLPRRIVLRHTRVYFLLQRQQLEPHALRSAEAQALVLEQLGRSFLLAEECPLHWPVFAAEVRQMQMLDIPFFTHDIDGDALDLDADGTRLPRFIEMSALTAARERIATLDEEEISFQLRLIRGAVGARHLRSGRKESDAYGCGSESASIALPTADALLPRIADRLADLAIRDPKGNVEWLGMDLGVDGRSFNFGPVGTSLYGGSIGIACMLKHLATVSGHTPETKAMLAAIMIPVREVLEQPSGDALRRWWRDHPLGLSGIGGILLALQEIEEAPLAASMLEAAAPRYIDNDPNLDVMGGCAGLIGPLLRMGTELARASAVRAGARLVAAQREDGAWSAPGKQHPLLGFSHGTAGCAAALARLHLATEEERFLEAARKALAFERAHFDVSEGNWPDYRSPPAEGERPNFMVGWCHGAPGVAIGRACLWGTALWDTRCVEEIAIALETTAATQSMTADHLCCGTLGLQVVLQSLASGPWPIDTDLRTRSLNAAARHRRVALARSSGDRLGLRCFDVSEGSLDLPGFFTGLSGMGLALLEGAEPSAMVSRIFSAGLWPQGL